MEEEKIAETVYCGNCKKDIASSNFQMHEVHCKRHIVLCDYCQEPVPRTQLEEHFEDNHTEAPCDLCGGMMAKDQIEQHKEDECRERMIHCEYCELDVKAPEFGEHQAACGSRTDECDRCRQRVMLRYMADHHEHECSSKPRPVNPYRRSAAALGGGRNNRPKDPSQTTRRREDDRPRAVPRQLPTYVPVGGVREQRPVGGTPRPDDMLPTVLPNGPPPIVGVAPLDEGREREQEMFGGGRHPPSNPTMVFDQEWVGSVANALENDTELDSAIAGSVYQEELTRAMTHHRPDEHTGTKEIGDQELARRLQEDYDRQRVLSFNDAAIAKNLNEGSGTLTQVDDLLNNRAHAHQLYDTLEDVQTEKEPSEDSLLAQQLHEEERFNHEGGLPTMMLYNRAMIHEREKEERQRQIERDQEVAAMLQGQEDEEIRRGQLHPYNEEEQEQPYVMGMYEPPHDSPPPYVPKSPTPEPEPVAVPPLDSEKDQSSLDERIPCDICEEMVDFKMYTLHLEERHPQFTDVVDRYSDHPRPYEPPPQRLETLLPSSVYPPPQDYTHHPIHPQFHHRSEGGGAIIQQEERDVKVACKFCAVLFPPRTLETHMTICDKNPEEDLKRAYQNQEDEDIPKELETVIPCQFCGKQFKLIDVAEHQDNCRYTFGIHGDKCHSRGATKNEEEGVPCTTCGENYPISIIHTHQVTCEFRSKHQPQIPAVSDSYLPNHKTNVKSDRQSLLSTSARKNSPLSEREMKSSDQMFHHTSDPVSLLGRRPPPLVEEEQPTAGVYSRSDYRSEEGPDNSGFTGRPNGKQVTRLIHVHELTPSTVNGTGSGHVPRGSTDAHSTSGTATGNSHVSSPRNPDSSFKKGSEQSRGSGSYKPRNLYMKHGGSKEEEAVSTGSESVAGVAPPTRKVTQHNTRDDERQSSSNNKYGRKKLAANFNVRGGGGSGSRTNEELGYMKQHGDIRRERNNHERVKPPEAKYGVFVEDEDEEERKMKLKKGSPLNRGGRPYNGGTSRPPQGSWQTRSGGLSVRGEGVPTSRGGGRGNNGRQNSLHRQDYTYPWTH